MNPLVFLILFPFAAALLLLVVPQDKLRRALAYIAALIILSASVYLLYQNSGGQAQYYNVGTGLADEAMLAAGGLVTAYIIYVSIRFRKYYPLILVVLQSAVLGYLELNKPAAEVSRILFLDNLSLVMALVIGVIGGLICIYSVSYMKKFHEEQSAVKDRRGLFFFVMYAFLGAMFGLVFSDNIMWIYFFWELTTICSFMLIGYTGTKEAIGSAFRALSMNLLGSTAFALAIFYLWETGGYALTLDRILLLDKSYVLIPAALIGFAGLTKSAQLPFSSWLVGAMVAPAPVSALLHSSTMVKAGVYLMVRFAPIYQGSVPGILLSLVGGTTFLVASGIAITQSNAKKVLAYSTIATLGLIAASAGVGTYEAVWAAVFLIIFHAIAKSLMFLSVGTFGHITGSRNIEDMEGLVTRMPPLALVMIIGIAGMFLAPFGMLISKWAALRAFIGTDPPLFGIVAFGSGMTVFFWAKWMGKLVTMARNREVIREKISTGEMSVLAALAALTLGSFLLFPVVSKYLVEPFVLSAYGVSAGLAQENITIMLLMFGAVLVLPFGMLYFAKKGKEVPAYMGGRPTTPDMHFLGTAGVEKELSLKNYYLENIFGEALLVNAGVRICAVLIAIMFLFAGLIYAGALA